MAGVLVAVEQCPQLTASARKRLQWIAAKAFAGPSQPGNGTAVELLADVLAEAEGCDVQPSVPAVKERLRLLGHRDLASRVGRMSKARNGAAHPDKGLPSAVRRALNVVGATPGEASADASSVSSVAASCSSSHPCEEQVLGVDLGCGWQKIRCLEHELCDVKVRLQSLELERNLAGKALLEHAVSRLLQRVEHLESKLESDGLSLWFADEGACSGRTATKVEADAAVGGNPVNFDQGVQYVGEEGNPVDEYGSPVGINQILQPVQYGAEEAVHGTSGDLDGAGIMGGNLDTMVSTEQSSEPDIEIEPSDGGDGGLAVATAPPVALKVPQAAGFETAPTAAEGQRFDMASTVAEGHCFDTAPRAAEGQCSDVPSTAAEGQCLDMAPTAAGGHCRDMPTTAAAEGQCFDTAPTAAEGQCFDMPSTAAEGQCFDMPSMAAEGARSDAVPTTAAEDQCLDAALAAAVGYAGLVARKAWADFVDDTEAPDESRPLCSATLLECDRSGRGGTVLHCEIRGVPTLAKYYGANDDGMLCVLVGNGRKAKVHTVPAAAVTVV